MKAIALIRVSTQAQELESQSIKVKEAILKDGFGEDDIIFIQDHESASKLSEEERSGLNKLKHHIETEQVSSVYAYEISRISRRATVVFSIRDYLLSRGIQLVILNPYFKLLKDDGTLDESSNIFFGIFSSMSENETYIRTQRIMRGKNKKKSEGKLTCGNPIFGYTVDKEHNIIPDPINSLIVKEIFERYANLESSGSIGKDLWMRGAIKTSSTKMETTLTYICVILKEKRYAKIDPDSIYPSLISKELWNKVQDIHSNKPSYFIRKSKTIGCYPLQGYIFNEDGYMLSPSISNNRYLKMNGVGERISLNMKVADELSKIVMNKYLESGAAQVDREKEIKEINKTLINNKLKLSTIDSKIKSLQDENERINERIIKNRMSEAKGDAMIDSNVIEMNKLEDNRQELIYSNSLLNNKLDYLANPMFNQDNVVECETNEQLKDLVIKYLKKIVVHKIGFSRYKLDYYFLDGTQKSGCFYSINHKVEYYDIK